MDTAQFGEKADSSPEQTATHLIAQLTGELQRNEDAEAAVDVYKTANWIIRRLEEVKKRALDLAQKDMEQRGLGKLDTPTGSAGWTEPQARELDEETWAQAMAKDPRLMEAQSEFEAARATLKRAQEPFRELPEPRFYIR